MPILQQGVGSYDCSPLLQQYRHFPNYLHNPASGCTTLESPPEHGGPVVMHSSPWTHSQLDAAMAHGSHFQQNACHVVEGPVADATILWCCQLEKSMPSGVIPLCNCWPCTIANYTCSRLNADTTPITDTTPLLTTCHSNLTMYSS